MKFAHPAVGIALATTVGGTATVAARRTLGELVAGLSRDARARWHCYRLLAGTSEGIDVLLLLAAEVVAPQAAGTRRRR